jgi:haloalkane dehalogenase
MGKFDPKKTSVEVLGHRVAYTEAGSGRPVLFLHGGIGSSFIWRNVIPHVAPYARCVAVDLIGTGDSSRYRPSGPDSYQWANHLGYLGALMRELKIAEDVTLVMHGWASIVGLEWARLNEHRVRAMCNIESIIRPLGLNELNESFRSTVKLARSAAGERYVMDSNAYFDAALDVQVNRQLSQDVVAEYRRTFGDLGETRRATHSALSQIPVGGKPAESVQMVRGVSQWLKKTPIPKLLVLGNPGYLIAGRGRELAVQIPDQTVAEVTGTHLLPEESPDGVGMFLSLWIEGLD